MYVEYHVSIAQTPTGIVYDSAIALHTDYITHARLIRMKCKTDDLFLRNTEWNRLFPFHAVQRLSCLSSQYCSKQKYCVFTVHVIKTMRTTPQHQKHKQSEGKPNSESITKM